jgi:UDP-N-acetyl-D-mannosaminuronate dehydrogenase
MNIQTVAENLKNTIAGKERMLTAYNATLYKNFLEGDVLITAKATVEFLEINIAELKRVLQDVEQCVEQAADHSWMINPDRMGGGGYSADELDPNRGWK